MAGHPQHALCQLLEPVVCVAQDVSHLNSKFGRSSQSTSAQLGTQILIQNAAGKAESAGLAVLKGQQPAECSMNSIR